MRSERMKRSDDENTAFGFPVKVVNHKSGFDGDIAEQDVDTGNNNRLSPRDKKQIPQKSLAARIGKIRKEG